MPFLSAAGIKKLTELKAKVQIIFDKKYGEDKQYSSGYSKNMAASAIAIIDHIIKSNDKSVSSIKELEKLFSPIEKSLGIIDNQHLDAIPVVFNSESADIAIAFRDYLQAFDITQDTGSAIDIVFRMKTLFSKAPKDAILKQHAREVDANIRMYHAISRASKNITDGNSINKKIYRQKSLYQSSSFTIIDESAKDKIQAEYKEFINTTIKEIQLLPCVSLKQGTVDLYNKKSEPFDIVMENLHAMSLTSDIFMELLNVEDAFNKKLPPDSKRISIVVDELRLIYTKKSIDAYKAKVLDQLINVEREMQTYLTGKHLMLFKTIPAEKQQIIQGMLKLLKETKDNKDEDSISRSPFNLFKEFTTANATNLAVSKSKRISPGECARILSTYLPIMLELAMERPIGNDERLFNMLEREKAESLQPKAKSSTLLSLAQR